MADNIIVRAAGMMGQAVGSFIKARDRLLQRGTSFVSGLSESSRWKGGDMANSEAAQMRAVRNGWYFTGVNLKSMDLASSKLDIFHNPTGLEDDGKVAEAHPFYTVLRRPNPYMGQSLMWQYTHWWMELDGNAYWFIEPGNGGIKGLWPLPAKDMDIEFTDDGKAIKRYVYKASNWFYLDPNYICHFRYPNPWDFFRGMSRLIAMMMTVDADLAMRMWNGRFFGRDNVMPSAIISVGSGDAQTPIEESDINNLTDQLRSEYGALARKTVITNANTMTAALLGYNAKDMDFLAGMGWNKEEILWMLGVPAGMVDKNSTEANATVGNKVFKDNMWGEKSLYADEITNQILKAWYDDALEARYKDDRIVDRELQLREAELAKDAMTREEWARKYFGVEITPETVTMNDAKAQQAMEVEQSKIAALGNKYPGNKGKVSESDPASANPKNAAPKDIKAAVTLAGVPGYKEGHLPTMMLCELTHNKGQRTTEQLEELREYTRANGVTSPIWCMVDEDGNLEILDGKHRVDFAKEFGIEQCPVVVVNEDADKIDPEIVYRHWLASGATNKITGAKSLDDELMAFYTKAINYFKKQRMARLEFHSDVIDDGLLKSMLDDLHNVENRDDIAFIFQYWKPIVKGGPGSGEEDGHPFRGNQWTSTYKDARGQRVYKVSAGANLADSTLEDIKKAGGTVRVIYNTSSKNWHISSKGLGDADHGDFAIEALDGFTPAYTEMIQSRGIYDADTNTLTLYDFSGESEHIANFADTNEKVVSKRIEKVLNEASSKTFYVNGKKPKIEILPFDEFAGGKSLSMDFMKALSWRPWSAFEPGFISAIFSALKKQLEMLLGLASETMAEDDTLWTRLADIMKVEVQPVVTDIVTHAAKKVFSGGGGIGVTVSWDVMNGKARDWGLQYAATQITKVDETTKKAVRQVIADWMAGGKREGVQGLRTMLEAMTDGNGVPLFGEARAERIARSEITSIYAGGTEAALVSNGYPPAVYKPRAHVNCRCYIQPGRLASGEKVIVWYTARDEMVCKMELDTPWGTVEGCKELHRTIISEGRAGEKWEGNKWNPSEE